jgi:hypothetical protein
MGKNPPFSLPHNTSTRTPNTASQHSLKLVHFITSPSKALSLKTKQHLPCNCNMCLTSLLLPVWQSVLSVRDWVFNSPPSATNDTTALDNMAPKRGRTSEREMSDSNRRMPKKPRRRALSKKSSKQTQL